MASGGGEFIVVAAIDFGTAYSGYAFSFRHTFKADPTKVLTNSWPAGTGCLLSLKTSTCALFDPKKKFHSFGYEAEDKYSDLALDQNHTDWYFFNHFKMDLFEKVVSGTVDITVHEVKEDSRLSEIYKASGGSWGGTYVDKAFKTFLSNIIGNEVMGAFIKDKTLDYVELFRSFEVKKRSFQARVTDKVMFKVPVSMNETHVAMKKKNIKDVLQTTQYAGQISWTGDKVRISPEIVNSFFDDPCEKIVKHLEKIFSNPKVDGVDFILMVGGFSESRMLQEYVKDTFPNKRVIVPNEAGLAVLKGAVIFGHDTNAISERKAKYTYGVETCIPFLPGKHPEDKLLYDDSGACMCQDIFDTHVQIGGTIKTGDVSVAQSYSVTGEDQTEIAFNVFASKKRKPKFVTDPGCILIGTLDLEMPGHGLERSALVHIMFGDTELHVHAVNEQTGEEASAKFDFLSGDHDDVLGSDSISDESDSDSDTNDVVEDISDSSENQTVLDFLCFESDYDGNETEDDYSD